ncbi:WD40/YVTN/BNR-like repeat-containing protein [Paenibacillus kobensis]|uniref:WD40/YVTN/BNR-like repeat-containing protein n=1 Tax=Paenibacillus kobensis TaxID=59841 RepID=UPI000FD7EC1F|nr:hypothetical protein [Paenibacillus kobensis]
MKGTTFLLVLLLILSGCAAKPSDSIENRVVTDTTKIESSTTPLNAGLHHISEFSMHDNDKGWVLSGDEQGYKYLYHTQDRLQHLQDRTPWSMKQHVFFFALNDQSAWAVWEDDNEKQLLIWHTNNGGVDWSQSSFNETIGERGAGFHNLYFISDQIGWMHITDNSGADFSTSLIYFTDTGGDSWKPIVTQSDANIKLGVEGNKGKIMFKNQKEGFLGTTHVAKTPVWYRSHDSGNSWGLEPLIEATDHSGEERIFTVDTPIFFDDKQGIAAVTGNQLYSIFTTQDGGSTWIERFTNPSPNINQLSAIDTEHLWAVDNKFDLIHIDNIEDQWQTVINAEKISGIKNSIIQSSQFITDHEGWVSVGPAGASANIYHTVDGGASWEELEPIID